jgi:hypothetical protein
MRTHSMTLETIDTFIARLACGFASMALPLLCLLLTIGLGTLSFAQESKPRTFSFPGEASEALFQAAQKDDEPALETILGAGKEVTSSTDEAEDKLEREQFSKKYQEMHRLVREPDGSTVLYVGAENWPFPIRLVAKNGKWYFDSDRGQQEILFRRIGGNEASAIETCHGLVLAKRRESTTAGDDPVMQYAESLVAAAGTEDASRPFDGYYFRMLNGQSKTGAGYGFIAYPAEYRSSGVLTFVVTAENVVYERDLGPNTAKLAKTISVRTISGWHPAE